MSSVLCLKHGSYFSQSQSDARQSKSPITMTGPKISVCVHTKKTEMMNLNTSADTFPVVVGGKPINQVDVISGPRN